MSLRLCCHARAGLELACHAWHGSSVICGCGGGQLLSVDAAGHVAELDSVLLPSAVERGGCEAAAACQGQTEQPVASSQATAPSGAGETPPAPCQAAQPEAPAEADAAAGTGMPRPGGSSHGLPAAPVAAAGLAWLAEADPAAVACVAAAEGLLVAACTRRRGTVLRCGAHAEACIPALLQPARSMPDLQRHQGNAHCPLIEASLQTLM